MVTELRLKSVAGGVVLARARAAGAAGGAEIGVDPRLSTAFAERWRHVSPGGLGSSTGVSAAKGKEATA